MLDPRGIVSFEVRIDDFGVGEEMIYRKHCWRIQTYDERVEVPKPLCW
jgi:hypothetical protein